MLSLLLPRVPALVSPRRPAMGQVRLRGLALVAGLALAAATSPAQAQTVHISRVAGSGAFDAQHLVFDGVDDYVSVPHKAAHALTNAVTLEAWVKPSAFVQNGGIATKGINGTQWTLTTLGDGRLEFISNFNLSGGTAFAAFQSTSRLTLGVWQHVAVAVGGGFVRFYINGVLGGESAQAITFATTTEPIIIGADLPGGDEFFRGAIDEVRVWNVVRTGAEIAANRTTVFGPTTGGLVGYWDFDALEDLGVGAAGVNDVRDRSSSSAHGDVVGGITRVTAWAMKATSDLYEDRVVLAWSRVPSATARYLVRRDGLLLATLSASDTTYTDRAGVAGQAYPYCVSRQDGPTTTALGCEQGRRQLISAGAVSASDGTFTDRVRVTWTDRSAINTGYKVYRAGTLVATLGAAVAFDDTTKTALTPGTAYAYCVAPTQGDGEGLQVCDNGTRGSVLPPATVVATDGTVPGATRITWTAPAGGDPTTGTPPGAIYQLTRNGRALMGAYGTFTYLDHPNTGDPVKPVAGTTYTYCVTRQLPGGAESVLVCDAGGFGTLPTPTNVTASDSSSDSRVDVRWSNNGGASDGVRVTRQGGYGLAFDGVDDGVEVAGFALGSNVVTVEAWVKPTGSFVDGASIVTKGRSATPWSFLTTADGRLRLAANFGTTGGTAATNVLSTGTLTLGAWQHVAMSVGNGIVRFYINGVLAGETAQEVVFGTNSEPLYLGSDLVGAVAYFRGEMDEVRVWSTVRTQAEIRAGMHAASTGAESGLATLYHLDDGIGTLVTDSRGGNHGRLVGMTGIATSGYVAAGAPVAGQGQNAALRLDGTDDHAVVNGLTALPSSFTVEFWARRTGINRGDFAIGQGASTNNNGLNIGFRNTNTFLLSFTNNDLDTPQPFTDLGWHHWAVTYDRPTGRRTIVRDGAEVASDIASAPYTGTGTLRIGQSTGNGINGYFGGDLDDIRVWSRVRPAASIAANRFALADTARAGLVGAWSFDALDAAGTAAMATAPGVAATGAASGAVLTNGASLVAGRPLALRTLAAGSTSYPDLTAEPGLRYTYCVTSFASAGAETAAACDGGSRARAIAPAVVIASDGTFENNVTIAWQGVSTRAATYNVYRDATLIATLPATQASFEDKTGAPTTVYTYCVAAFTSDGAESGRVCNTGSRVLRAPTVSASDDTQEDSST